MSTSNPTTSIYEPLRNGSDEIRLITIKPSSELGDEILCNIDTVELRTSPAYLALSYAWGDADVTEEINVDGSSLRVTTNLAAALRRLRCWKGPTRFWIDAICINQTSVLEKNHQLPLMRSIYSQAERVVMWLGEEENNSSLAITFINRWHDAFVAAVADKRLELKTRHLERILSLVEDPFDKQSVLAVRCLFERGYWSRVWIIQEIVLAKDRLILCGRDSVDASKMSLICYIWFNLSSIELPKLGNQEIIPHYGWGFQSSHLWLFVKAIEEALADGQTLNILSVVQIGFERFCTDPRDRLYGLFGIMDDKQLTMHPDYHLTTEEVNFQFTVGSMQTSGRVDAVTLAGIGFEIPASLHLISWVPRYIKSPSGKQSFLFWPSGNGRAAAADSEAEFTILNSHLLHVRGILCGEIAKSYRSESANELKCAYEKREWLWEWLTLARSVSCDASHPTGIPWRQAFFKTMIADRTWPIFDKAESCSEEIDKRRFYELAEGFMTFMRCSALQVAHDFAPKEVPGSPTSGHHELLDDALLDIYTYRSFDITRSTEQQQHDKEVFYWLANSSTTRDETLRAELLEKFCGNPGKPEALKWPYEDYGFEVESPNFRMFTILASLAIPGRSFFVTADGYMGLSPLFAERGDLICVLLGCSVPMIIRRCGTNYVVVGDAYVYGMMKDSVEQTIGRLSRHGATCPEAGHALPTLT
ncbi:heterokaryon incompatibility protein-domain-containing protein [Hyaloscypha finlandica]|nr:heterokaryon incompatibility protein-domain-containing protein [Hyaloscypha finlandica]